MIKLKLQFLAVLFVSLFIHAGCANAQPQSGYSTKNKKAIKLFNEARNAPRENINPQTGGPDYETGISLLNKALEKDGEFIEAHLMLAEMYMITRQNKLAVEHYKKSLEINPNFNLNGLVFYDIGELQFKNAEYEDAIKYMEIVTQNRHGAISKELYQEALKIIESAEFAISSKENPLKIDPKNIGPSINTEHPEYFPTMTVDGRTFLFTRELPIPGRPEKFRGQEDFFIAKLNDKNIWEKAQPMPPHINTDNNEGAPTLSADGRTLIFVGCADHTGEYGEGRYGKGSCDLFITKKIGNQWTKPINLPGEVNTFHWESQPSLSADGKTLYYVRRAGRPGTQRSDIYYSTLGEDGRWSKGISISDKINTPFQETSVHIHPDGQTIYFSSNGHVGLGGFDIFMSKKDLYGNWGEPVNLGYPINTEHDENSLLVDPNGEIAFFASDRKGGYGKLDIYYFELPAHLRPTKTTYFAGKVFDINSKNPLEGKFELIDLETGNQIIQATADKITGEFTVPLPINKNYALNVSYPGYSFYSVNFDLSNLANTEAYHMDVPMTPIDGEGSITLANVFFDLNKSTLRKASFIELNKLIDLLNENQNLKIEIQGHTDTRGDANKNLQLSIDRALSVKNYLIENGIAENRLTSKGYGQIQPIVSDEEIDSMQSETEKEQAHQQNRRTAYKFIK